MCPSVGQSRLVGQLEGILSVSSDKTSKLVSVFVMIPHANFDQVIKSVDDHFKNKKHKQC